MSWTAAALRGAVVFVYFLVATVWIPHLVLKLGFIETGSSLVRDLVVSVVWIAALAGGMYGLRRAQREGLI